MKILYGVASEGIGHAVTSSVVADHLLSRGHEITFACAKGTRACSHLSSRYGSVISVSGLTIAHDRSGRTNHLKTIWDNLKNLALMSVEPVLLATLPAPDVVITDFEPVTARYANLLGLPCIAINNIHLIDRCSHPKSVVGPHRRLAAVSLPAAVNVVPKANHYIVPTFVQAKIRKPRTSLHLPILERMPTSTPGSEMIVYFNGKAPWPDIVQTLQNFGQIRFRCYGSGKVGSLGNVILCPPSDKFVDEFARARAVIGGSGFTLVSRSIYAKKPLLAVPAEAHFEQTLNASYLQALKYGATCSSLTPQSLAQFIDAAPTFEKNLAIVSHDGNSELFRELDRMLGC